LRLVILLIAAGSIAGESVRAQTVAIITADSLISTRRTVSGAKRNIRREHPDVIFRQFLITPDLPGQTYTAKQILSAKPAAILTVGSAATQFAKKQFSEDIPIVFSSVMYPVLSGFVSSLRHPGSNITGASLNIPVDIQFRNFIRVVPDLHRVGVLYSSNTAALIPPAKEVARHLGLQLVAIQVDAQRDLAKSLDSLTSVCDGLWSVADPNLFSPQSTQFILLQTIRRGIPFMGFSRYVVESGALFALDFDYKAVGRQAGKQVARILSGEKSSRIPVTAPDIIWFHYNERTAQHINVTIPEDLVAIAKEVYR